MSQNYLEMLEEAYLECQNLDSPEARADYIAGLEKVDRNLARELSSILSLRDETTSVLDISCGQFCSIMFTTLGESKKTETKDELIDFLKQVSPSETGNGIANLAGIELQELVGMGATGFVFKAWDTELCRSVAVKVLAPSIARDPAMRKTFAAEARLASSVRHNNVVSIYHTFCDPISALAYFVMEWVEGFTLQEWLDKREESQPDQMEANWVEQLVQAVTAIHEKEIIHRDLKPANILIDEKSNNLILIDFGLAFEKTELRQSKYPKGTPLYMSPEQLQGGTITQQSDLFSLAEIVCLLRFGIHPFMDNKIDMLTQKIVIEAPVLPLSAGHPIRPVFEKAFAKDFRDRYQTAESFQDDLQQAILEGNRAKGGPSNVSSARIERSAIPQPLALLMLAILVALPLIWVWYGWQSWGRGGDFAKQRSSSARDISLPMASNDFGNGAETFENYLGMTMLNFKINPEKFEAWPEEHEQTALFRGVNWQNRVPESFFLARNLVTISQYEAVMGELPPGNAERGVDEPVVGVILSQCEEFCRRVTASDPLGLRYGCINSHDFHFAMYGDAYFNKQKSIDLIVSDFDDIQKASLLQKKSNFPLQDVFGSLKEWTTHNIRGLSASEGVISYQPFALYTKEEIFETVGGFSGQLFLHLHDMQFGMNDFYEGSNNLKLYEERDADTSYLCPEVAGEEAKLIYKYDFDSPIDTAKISDPFSLFSDSSSAGIRVRGRSRKERDSLIEKEWKSVFQIEGKHMQGQPLRVFDLSEYLQGCVEVEVQYWIKAGEEPLNYTQMGRTISNVKLGVTVNRVHQYPNCFRFEAVTKEPVKNLRGFTSVPSSYRSPSMSFRIGARE